MKIKKKNLYILTMIVIIIVAAASLYYGQILSKKNQNENMKNEPDRIEWLVDKNGYLYYPLEREAVKFSREDYGIDGNLSIHKIIYQSRNGNIHGLLVLPASAEEALPGIVLLPGAGVSKESELGLAKKIALLDAAVLVIDQRGTGETTGQVNSIEQDYLDFADAKEPSQHLMVYDALRAYDLLHSAPFVDPERTIMVGESLGGRIAVIAAAIDRNINGVLVISSAGFDFRDKGDLKKDAFIKSIDSDHYIEQIAPRRVVMIHSINDTIIPISSAANSFSKAQEPKQFILINDTSCRHGYCDAMHSGLVAALDYLVDIRSKTILSVPEQNT
ncbi:alpha/beta fold hydrolase [Candidatus Woesearchaeota archaeon]|nr:alpha/beta fold hydrolase [Candidatus Woesearchaeota archaeon]